MKKKITIMFIVFIMMLSIITGCKAKDKDTTNYTEGTNQEEQEDVTNEQEGKSSVEDINNDKKEIDSRLVFDLENKYVHYKLKYPKWSTDSYEGHDYVIERNGNKDDEFQGLKGGPARIIISSYYEGAFNTYDQENCDINSIKSSTDIVDGLKPKMEFSLNDAYFVTLDKFDYQYEETTIINEVEMTKFSGIAYMSGVLDSTYEYQIVGYTIMGKETPSMIWAIDASKEQNQMEELSGLVDAIVQTYEDGKLEE